MVLANELLSERQLMKPTFDRLESRDVPSSMLTLTSDPSAVLGSGPGTYSDMMTPIYGAVGSVTGGATGAVADTVMGSSTTGSTMLVGTVTGATTVVDTQINPDGSLNTSNLSSPMNVPIYTQPLPGQPSQPTSPTNPQFTPQVMLA